MTTPQERQFEGRHRVDAFLQLPEAYYVPGYELDDNKMIIHDSIWGEMTIDGETSRFDGLLIELANTPLLQRIRAIEQLTLGDEFATMPSSTNFSRWSHAWGSLTFIRKMNEGRDITPRESEVMQLRTLLSDVGHTAFSHLGDWMFQPRGSGENLHDQELKQLLITSGVAALLKERGYGLEEVVSPDVEDWVECPLPDLNVDRVDYALREMMRWQTSFTGLNYYQGDLNDPQKLFTIVDNKLAIKDPVFAAKFAAGYALLPTEHWAHPVHRLQLDLFRVTMQRILTEMDGVGHPRDQMYAVDTQFDGDFQTWDVLRLVNTMKNIGRSQRQIFAEGRIHDLGSIFRSLHDLSSRKDTASYVFPDFPDPLETYTYETKQFGLPYPPELWVEEARYTPENDLMSLGRQGLHFSLPGLKKRAIDPLIVTRGGELKRLSDHNSTYGPYLEGQTREMARHYFATILLNNHFTARIQDMDRTARAKWEKLLERPRDPERLNEIIRRAGEWGVAHSFDSFDSFSE